MKKFNFKTRIQWGWFKAALAGAALAILIAPAAGNILDTGTEGEKENPVISMLGSISFGPKIKVIINGDVVALAKSEAAGEEAYKAARLAYNADGVKVLDVDVTYEEVDKEKDKESIKGMHVLRKEKLADAILESFDNYAESDKALAYTMRIDDYTVTVDRMEDLISILEQAQSSYDTEDAFKVGLEPPASRNVTMYEVAVTKKEEESEETAAEADTEVQVEDTEGTTETPEETGAVIPIQQNQKVNLTGEEASTQTAESSESTDTEAPVEDTAEPTALPAEDADASIETSDDGIPEDTAQTSETDAAILEQAANDGVKFVGFAETIQVMETYVDKAQIKDRDTAYNEITAKNAEASIYVVEPGDCLSVIAEKNNLSVEEIKELNPSIESDDDIYYDDRLNITVPRAAVQILVEKQETYEESYNEDIVYQDDDSMYIGETEVVQEGTPGTHTVTDMVTYKDDIECDREQLQETVEVAAVAQVVRRGTKSKPTYMFPVTNWNVTSNFGYRWGRLHAGTDVGVPVGTTVRASRAGQVVTAGWLGGYGNCVIIDHGDGVCTRYGHLSEVTVSVGQYVDQGQQIALSGNTGRSTGPHLHFEIRINGEAVDPLPYLYQTQ
ncbi:MAG: peptidoglycan DD-metalloendopeptidase family protein [Lachnospiraceae bacterium]